MWDSNVYECPTPVPIYELVQHQAQVTIPSKQGCYRMGLYDIIEGVEPQYNCDLSLTYLLENNVNGSFHEVFFDELATILATSATPYISFTYTDGNIYTYDLTQGISEDDIATWCNANIPNMNATGNPDASGWQWQVTVPCNENGYVMSCYHSDVTGELIEVLWETAANLCLCEPTCNVQFAWGAADMNPYPFEDILSYTDEYVGIILGDSTGPSTGIPIIVYKRPVSDFLISPGSYDIGAIFQWINSIPGLHFYENTDSSPLVTQSYTNSWNVNIPCSVNSFADLAFLDINDNILLSQGSFVAMNLNTCSEEYPFLACCQCNSQCEQTFTYVWEVENSGNVWTWVDTLLGDDLRLFGIYVNGTTNSYTNYVNYHPFLIPQGGNLYDRQIILTYLNTVPGLSVAYDDVANTLTFNWTLLVPCDTDLVMRFAGFSYNNYPETLLWTSTTESCTCPIVPEPGQFYSALYSLSNIINIDRADCFSTILEFWSDNNTMAEGFEYYNNWKQRVRIGLNGGGEKPIIEESLYRQSNGVHRRPQNKQDLSLDLHTDFLDLDTQLAMTDATRHPYLVWEGKPIFVKGDIEVATTQDFTTQSSFETLSQMKFQALLQGFQPRNSSCLNC
jgi:hypothetical protein